MALGDTVLEITECRYSIVREYQSYSPSGAINVSTETAEFNTSNGTIPITANSGTFPGLVDVTRKYRMKLIDDGAA